MEYVVKTFHQLTNWNPQANSYEHLTDTSEALLDFTIPNSFKFQLSNNSSPYTYNTLEITARQNNRHPQRINGYLTYLYTNVKNLHDAIHNSNDISLQDATQTYKHVQPSFNTKKKSIVDHEGENASLYYGRIYYPTSDLEAMVMKRLKRNSQLTFKWLSSPINNLNILTIYWQLKTRQDRNLHEFIYSTNDSLCGYRVLHNFVSGSSKFNNSLYNNSSLSVGGEVWLSLKSHNPGGSTSIRYCTHSANTGRPLTLTFSYNPLFGHISSTYAAKTGLNSTFCTRYDFNIYSIDSNLTFGWEFWKNNSDNSKLKEPDTNVNSLSGNSSLEVSPLINTSQQKLLNDLTYTFSSSLEKIDKEKTAIEKFQKKINESNFTNVWKFSTSLKDKNLKIKWEGKFKGFLLSAGTELYSTSSIIQDINGQTNFKHQKNERVMPLYPGKFGFQLQYSK